MILLRPFKKVIKNTDFITCIYVLTKYLDILILLALTVKLLEKFQLKLNRIALLLVFYAHKIV